MDEQNERGMDSENTKQNEWIKKQNKIETKAVQVNKSEHKMNSNELRQYYTEWTHKQSSKQTQARRQKNK